MTRQLIIKSIKSIVSLNKEEETTFLNILEVKQFKKKDYLLREGQVCNKITFLNKGSARLFYNVEGTEKTIQFFFENSWHTDYASFLTGKPTIENLQALEDTEVVQFLKNDLQKLYKDIPKFERVGRVFAENAFLSVSQLNQMKTNEEPERRYLNLLKKRPELIQRIPQHYIASYLGIQPETLSRIRKRISSSK